MNWLIIIILAVVFYFFIETAGMGTSSTTSASIPAMPSLNINDIFGNISGAVSSGVNSLVQDIQTVGNATGVNPAILYGIVSAEQGSNNPQQWNTSAYNPNDPSGAYGLTQILGTTAASLRVNPSTLLDSPSLALGTTASYILKYSPDAESMSQTAAVYNGGPGIFANTTPSVQSAVSSYVAKAVSGEQYYNNNYGG